MSNFFDAFEPEVSKAEMPLTLKGKPVVDQQWVDPDTMKASGKTYRITDFNAPEVAHLRSGVFTPAESADDKTMGDLLNIAKLGGYNKLTPGGTDKYGRTTATINNQYGDSLGKQMTTLGLTPASGFSDTASQKEQGEMRAAAALFPELAQKDPMVALSLLRQKEANERGWIAKREVPDEASYSYFKKNTGVGAVAAEAEEVKRLEGILQDPNLRSDLRVNLEKKLEESRFKTYQAATTPDIVGGVNFRSNDRNIMNQANSQLSTSFYNAMLDVSKQVGGLLQMAGDASGWDYLSQRAKSGTGSIIRQQQSLPDTLGSFTDIRTDKTWNTIKDTANYVGNLFAGTLPQMAIMYGTGGLGNFALEAVPMSLLYGGGFYAEQPDDKKNAPLALMTGVASGVLDKIGFEKGLLAGDFFTVAGKKELVEKLVAKELAAGKQMSKEEASKVIDDLTKKELVDLSKAGAEFAKKQYATADTMTRGVASLMGKGGIEAGTEAAQQLAEMIGKGGMWNLDAQYERDFTKQLMDSAVGGGIMGTGFHAAHNVKESAQWHSIADSYKPYEGDLNEAAQFQAENKRRLLNGEEGGYRDIKDAMTKTSLKDDSVVSREEDLSEIPSEKGVWSEVKRVMSDPMKLLRQHAETAVGSIIGSDGQLLHNKALLKAVMGGYGVLPGNHYAGEKQRIIGALSGATAEELATALGTNTATANQAVRDAFQSHWVHDQTLPQDSQKNVILQQWKDRMDQIRKKAEKIGAEAAVATDEWISPNALFESSIIDPHKLLAHKQQVLDQMIKEGATPWEANKILKNIVSENHEKAQVARDLMSKYGVFKNPELSNIFENNIFTSIENLKEKLATKVAHKEYLGNKGSNLAKLLKMAKANGEFETEQEYKNTVKEVQDWYNITVGDYHPLDDYPKLQKILGWGVTATMLASLGKAGLSSQVEVAMSMLGTPADLFNKQTKSYVDNLGREIRSDMNKGTSWAMSRIGVSYMRNVPIGEVQAKIAAIEERLQDDYDSEEAIQKDLNELKELHKEAFGYDLFERLGYNESGYNTQSKFEYAESNMKKAMQVFSAIIGLRAQTDAVRMAALSIAADVMIGKLYNLAAIPAADRARVFITGKGLNKGQAQDLMELQQYGMDPEFILSELSKIEGDPADIFRSKDVLGNQQGDTGKRVQEMVLTSLGNFVDSRVVNPQPHNLPKYFHDPRLRIVTAMGRFMAAAHATLLPKLYKQYLLDGNIGMRYQAFSVIIGALMLAHIMNMLKDQLAYGEDSPYIKGNRKKIQRAINSSGLIGQFERVVDQALPLYPQTGTSFTTNPVAWAGGKVTDVSPVAAWAAKIPKGATQIGEGKTSEGVNTLLRATPVVGSFPIAAKEIASLFK